MHDLSEASCCPFCKMTNVGYSVKVKRTISELYYHAAIYCKNCYAYGPRVLSDKFSSCSYGNRCSVHDNEELFKKAMDAWNSSFFGVIGIDLAKDSEVRTNKYGCVWKGKDGQGSVAPDGSYCTECDHPELMECEYIERFQ